MIPALIRALRPHQWVKNLFVLAPMLFAQSLLDTAITIRAVSAFFLFCFASSTVYLLNDLADVEADRQHPTKKNRPIASGAVSEIAAKRTAAFLALTAVGGGFVIHVGFGAAALSYLVLNLAYSAKLKRIAYVDVLCITTGFELRVLGGAFAVGVDPSNYLLLVTFLLASFLGFGKRMHELVQGEKAHKQRSVLANYDEKTLILLLGMTATATVVVYAFYTLDPHTVEFFGTDYLIYSTVFTAFGVFRFLQLVRNRADAESPTEQMLRDKPFLLNLALWVVAVVATIYFV